MVERNRIGTNSTGTSPLGNAFYGVLIDAGAIKKTIGGTVAGAANTISNNLYVGVALSSTGTGNLIEDDVIDSNGSGQPQSGLGDGVSVVNSASASVIGCTIDSNAEWVLGWLSGVARDATSPGDDTSATKYLNVMIVQRL